MLNYKTSIKREINYSDLEINNNTLLLKIKDIINEIEIGLMYFKLRKVKKMISQNQMDLETAPEKEQIQLLQIHKHLKEVERALTQGIGTVIMK